MKKNIIKTIIPIILFVIIFFLGYPVNKNARILIFDENNTEMAYIVNGKKSNTIIASQLDKEYISYILEIEDKDFYNHKGFSIKRIIKSIYTNITSDKTSGASTITQQYVKNTYLSNEKKISRKIKEIILSVKLENKMTKEEILGEYLSTIYFGNSIYGLKNAARYYYNKSITELTRKDIISFIALWNAPAIYSKDHEKWNTRKNQIAKQLLDSGLIKSDYNLIIEPINLNINKEYSNSNKLYFIDQTLQEFNKLNYCSNFNELITLNTKYNPKTENIKSDLNINYSIIGVNKEGYYVSAIGDNNYYSSSYNIGFNGNRDIGSTIKPILYYEAIKCGFEHKLYNSTPFQFFYKKEPILIINSSNNYYNQINMRTALAVSDNIYAIKTHLNLGMYTLVNHLKKYNINSNAYPSLALGSVGMSLNDLVKIYYQFFSDGYYINPKFIYAINGQRIKINNVIVNDKKIIKKIKLLLEAPFDNTIPHCTCGHISYKLNSKCYGKTGLTDYDSYMLGFNDNVIYGIWCGYVNNKKLEINSYKNLPKELFVLAMNAS